MKNEYKGLYEEYLNKNTKKIYVKLFNFIPIVLIKHNIILKNMKIYFFNKIPIFTIRFKE